MRREVSGAGVPPSSFLLGLFTSQTRTRKRSLRVQWVRCRSFEGPGGPHDDPPGIFRTLKGTTASRVPRRTFLVLLSVSTSPVRSLCSGSSRSTVLIRTQEEHGPFPRSRYTATRPRVPGPQTPADALLVTTECHTDVSCSSMSALTSITHLPPG